MAALKTAAGSDSAPGPRALSFVTWYPSCRRSDSLARLLGGVSHRIHYLKFKQPLYAPFKYVAQAVATLYRLRRDRARLVLVASPPVFAVAVVWFYAKLHRATYIIDAHSGVFDDPRWTWLLPLSRALSRGALTTIVTNRFLAEQVRSWGAHATVIGDVPLSMEPRKRKDLGSGFHVAVVNTFSQDEPLDQVVEAARKLTNVSFHITGSREHARTRCDGTLPANARFTGWLSDTDYNSLLLSADVVLCLTTHDHTMQRGAYEAMALEKPLITSNWALLRDTFHDGTLHVDNSASQIARAVRRSRMRRAMLAAGMRRLRRERLAAFSQVMHDFERILEAGQPR